MIAECLHPGCTRPPYAGAMCAQHARLPKGMRPVPTDAFVLPKGKARTRPPLPPLTPIQRAEGASERLLSALRDHYLRLLDDESSGISLPGYSLEKINYAIVLDAQGRIVQVNDLREASGKKFIPKSLSVPQPEKRTAGIKL